VKQPNRGLIRIDVTALQIHQYGFWAHFRQRAEALLAFAQSLVSELEVGDVDDDPVPFAIAVEAERGAGLDSQPT